MGGAVTQCQLTPGGAFDHCSRASPSPPHTLPPTPHAQPGRGSRGLHGVFFALGFQTRPAPGEAAQDKRGGGFPRGLVLLLGFWLLAPLC